MADSDDSIGRRRAIERRYREKHSKNPKFLYAAHRQNARWRNIPFLLTFEEWTEIWVASGKWEQRGSRRGQYCMARPGDQGAYEVGNVRIVLAEDNRAERNRNYPMKGDANPAAGKDYWATQSEEAREARRAKTSAFQAGRPKGKEMGAKLSATVTGRRRVYRKGLATWAYPGDPDFPE
jgi:hypothetical protein